MLVISRYFLFVTSVDTTESTVQQSHEIISRGHMIIICMRNKNLWLHFAFLSFMHALCQTLTSNVCTLFYNKKQLRFDIYQLHIFPCKPHPQTDQSNTRVDVDDSNFDTSLHHCRTEGSPASGRIAVKRGLLGVSLNRCNRFYEFILAQS